MGDWGAATATVTGIQHDRFVEFEFELDGPDLTVELVMPLAAFRQFCTARAARILPGDDITAKRYQALVERSATDPTDPTNTGAP